MTKPPYKATDVANWFLGWGSTSGIPMSHLKLQKLLYYAQGHYLARTGKPLFVEDVEAWRHGPVVAAVYQVFKKFGHKPITAEPQLTPIDEAASAFLDEITENYGPLDARRLREMTHAERPWKDHWDGDSEPIPISELREFFVLRERAFSPEAVARDSKIDALIASGELTPAGRGQLRELLRSR